MTRTVASILQIAGMAAVAVAVGIAIAPWAGIVVAGLAALGVGVLLELESVGTAVRPPGRQPSVSQVSDAIRRKFSRTFRVPDGTVATTAPPEGLESGAGDPTAEGEPGNSWIIRGPGR